MSIRIAALNNGNILSCSDQRISELQYINRLNQSRCLQSPCDAKLKWTTSVHLDPQKHQQDFIQLIGLKAKIQKLTQNHKSAGKKDEVSAVSQLSPRHPHKGHTHGVRASPDKHSHHLPWLDHAISCVCVCMAGRWPGQQRRERWQCKPRSPSPPRWNMASKVSFQTSYPRSTETSHCSSGVHIFCEFSWALLKCSFTQFLLHEFHTSIPSVLFKTSGSLPVSSLLRRHAVPWMQFRQLQEHSRSSSQKTRHRHTSLLKKKTIAITISACMIYTYIYYKDSSRISAMLPFFSQKWLNKFQAFRASALLLIVSGLPLIGVNLCHHNAGPIS